MADEDLISNELIERANNAAKKVSDLLRNETNGPYEATLAACSCAAAMAMEVTRGDSKKAKEFVDLIVQGMFS